jgi:hypothetical protein
MQLNIASWFIWFTTGLIEYITFDAIDSNITTSALPIACLLGIVYMGCVVFCLHIYRTLKGVKKTYFVDIEITDLILISSAVMSFAIFTIGNNPILANILIVSASILSFFPMWKAALRNESEHPGPWILMCIAYIAMVCAIVAAQSPYLLAQCFYPLFFFILHLIVALLAFKGFRVRIKTVYYSMTHNRKRKENLFSWKKT